jgi:hypothetical protein
VSTAEIVASSIAALSIIAGAAVAILAPLVSAKRDDARLERQLNAAQVDELRSVVEEAGTALTHACEAARDMSLVSRNASARREAFADKRTRMAAARLAVEANVNRIRIRVGPDDPLTVGYVEALDALVTLEGTLRAANGPDDPVLGEPTGDLLRSAHTLSHGFFAASAAALGPKMPKAERP